MPDRRNRVHSWKARLGPRCLGVGGEEEKDWSFLITYLCLHIKPKASRRDSLAWVSKDAAQIVAEVSLGN